MGSTRGMFPGGMGWACASPKEGEVLGLGCDGNRGKPL